MADPARRLAVLGSPIGHSKSPALHAAAYRRLGLDWEYSRAEVTEEGLAPFVSSLDATWRGLSLTMPLKEAVLPLLDEADTVSLAAGAANTLLLGDDGQRCGFNTDVGGIDRAFAERGVAAGSDVVLLGTGATARSALLALERLGVARILVAGRSPERVAATVAFALGRGLSAVPLQGDLSDLRWPGGTGLVVSTLPGGVTLDLPAPPSGAALFDVAYSGSDLIDRWLRADPGAVVVRGIDMLVHQALLQVRIFVSGDPSAELPDETSVLRAMDEAVGRS